MNAVFKGHGMPVANNEVDISDYVDSIVDRDVL